MTDEPAADLKRAFGGRVNYVSIRGGRVASSQRVRGLSPSRAGRASMALIKSFELQIKG